MLGRYFVTLSSIYLVMFLQPHHLIYLWHLTYDFAWVFLTFSKYDPLGSYWSFNSEVIGFADSNASLFFPTSCVCQGWRYSSCEKTFYYLIMTSLCYQAISHNASPSFLVFILCYRISSKQGLQGFLSHPKTYFPSLTMLVRRPSCVLVQPRLCRNLCLMEKLGRLLWR